MAASMCAISGLISIHALREEGDRSRRRPRTFLFIFLSTPSARRATVYCGPSIPGVAFLSTPSARRATVSPPPSGQRPGNFYPRPPRGGRRSTADKNLAALGFLSTPSARRATRNRQALHRAQYLFLSTPSARRATYLLKHGAPVSSRIFLSTPSARRATTDRGGHFHHIPISIHALREEGDPSLSAWSAASTYFYPRPPRGGRLHGGRM